MANRFAVLLSIPGLRAADLASMPRLSALGKGGATLPIAHTFPCLTCPSQAALTTGTGPEQHGVIANGFFWRDRGEVIEGFVDTCDQACGRDIVAEDPSIHYLGEKRLLRNKVF